MRILARIGAILGILMECFILLFPAVYLGETISTFNEKIATAYNSSYQEAYDQAYDARYQEGYNEYYSRGYDEGYQNGLEIGYQQGVATVVSLHNPTYNELIEFLARDTTDSKPYIEGEYVCSDFSAEVNNNAEAKGIRAAFVIIRLPQEVPAEHALIAFETKDKGLIFIEPQLDKVVKLAIGQHYWPLVGRTIPTDYDDTIVEIQIIW